MSNFPDLLTSFDDAVEALKVKLSQDESSSTTYNGEIIQSIAKDVKDRWLAVQALVDSALVFETKALMDAYTPTANTEGFYPLAKVWKDTEVNSGVYGYSGGAWIKSSYTNDIADTVDSMATSNGVSGSAVAKYVDPLYQHLDFSSKYISGGISSGTENLNPNLTWVEPDPVSNDSLLNRVHFTVRDGESDVEVIVKVYTKDGSNLFELVSSTSIGIFQAGEHFVDTDIELLTGQYIGFYTATGLLNYGAESGTQGYYLGIGELESGTISSLSYSGYRISIEYFLGSGSVPKLTQVISDIENITTDISDIQSDLQDDYVFFKGHETLIETGGSNTVAANWILNSPSEIDTVLTRFTLADVYTANSEVLIRVYSKAVDTNTFTVEREYSFISSLGTNVVDLLLDINKGEYLGIYAAGIFGFNAEGGVEQSIYYHSQKLETGESELFYDPQNYYFPWKFEVGGVITSPIRFDINQLKTDVSDIKNILPYVVFDYPEIILDYEINQFPCYGQSLSVGQAGPAISTSQNYDNLMFYRGMIPQYQYPSETPAEWYASLVPAVETDGIVQTALDETPNMGTGDMVKQLVESDLPNGTVYSYKMLLSSPGYGATTIAQLSKGTSHYSRLVEQFTYGQALTYADNQSYKARGCSWVQGESDYISGTTRSAYLASLVQLLADLKSDVDSDFKMISYQLSSHYEYSNGNPTIALALSDFAAQETDFVIACPMYHLNYNDSLHLTNESSRVLGGYLGIAYKKIFIDEQPFEPLTIKSATVVNGNQIHLKFNVPVKNIVIDTTLVPEATAYGFEIDGQTISSVSITGPDALKIVVNGTLSGGETLKYAATGTGNNTTAGRPRGNIRDSQGDSLTFDANGTLFPMHNWLLISEVVL